MCRPVTPSLWRKRGDRKFEAGLDYAVSSSPAWDTKLDTIKQGGEQKKEMVTVLTQPRKWRHRLSGRQSHPLAAQIAGVLSGEGRFPPQL